MSGRVSSWPAQRSARDCIRGRGWCEDIRKLAAASADGIEGVIVGQALYTGALALPEAIRLARCDTSQSAGGEAAPDKA